MASLRKLTSLAKLPIEEENLMKERLMAML